MAIKSSLRPSSKIKVTPCKILLKSVLQFNRESKSAFEFITFNNDEKTIGQVN